MWNNQDKWNAICLETNTIKVFTNSNKDSSKDYTQENQIQNILINCSQLQMCLKHRNVLNIYF